MRMLDTDVLIDVGRGYPPARQWLSSLTETPGVPNIVYMELIGGCQNKAALHQVQRLIASYLLFWLREPDCQLALALFLRFRLSHNLGLADALIAATAIGQGATLCTFNIKHFASIPGLVTEQPYAKP